MNIPIKIDPSTTLVDFISQHGNVHTDENGDCYLYFTQCLKHTKENGLTIEPTSDIPPHVMHGMLKSGLNPYHDLYHNQK